MVSKPSRIHSIFLFLVLSSLSKSRARAFNDRDDERNNCICKLFPRPLFPFKEKRARWMMHSLDWAALSTISTRLELSVEKTEDGESVEMEHVDESISADDNKIGEKITLPVPFGNVYSFVDGKCGESTGTPYFYGSYMDQTFKDILKNRAVSLTLSETAIPTVCSGSPIGSCVIGSEEMGDPESPVCARLVVSGLFKTIDPKKSPKEYQMAKEALFQRHPSMAMWPKNHDWVIAKIVIKDLWFLDMFGGATILDVNGYYGADLSSNGNSEFEKEVLTSVSSSA